MCTVCDTYRNARKVTVNVPTSATCQTLIGQVGNRLGYAIGTFLLYYQEPEGFEKSEEGVSNLSISCLLFLSDLKF